MKLKEFLKLNYQIGELHLMLRDFSNGGRRLIEEYRVGSHVQQDRVGKRNGKERWVTIAKSINTIENYRSGNAFWGIITGPIPNRILEMEVMGFVIRGKAFSLNNNLWETKIIEIDLKGNDADAVALMKEQADSDLDENGQLKGQMSFL